jgi:hypothetical protein
MKQTGFKSRTKPMPRGNGKGAGNGNGRGGIAASGSGSRGGTGAQKRSGKSGAARGVPGNAGRQSRKRPEVNADPGFPLKVKALISQRDEGCVLRGNADWGSCWGPVDAHHRRLIGSGGSTAPETHTASNGISLCRGHHDAIHRNRARAQAFGLIISRYWHPRRAPVSFDNGRTWWILWHSGHQLPAKPCHDCGHLDRTGNEPQEFYMVHDELWAEAGMEPCGGNLCVGCLEDRLFRQLTPADFTSAPINQPPFVVPLTARLLDRMGYGGDALDGRVLDAGRHRDASPQASQRPGQGDARA